MKKQLLSAIVILISFTLSGQCPVAGVLNWHFTADNNCEIILDAADGTEAYEMTFVGNYAGWTSFTPIEETFSGSLSEGLNLLNFDPTVVLPANGVPSKYFYEVRLRTQCASGEWSSQYQFYVSPYSMRNDPGFNCAFPFTTITFLADAPGFEYSTSFLVPPGEEVQEINDLGILVDIGHTYNGDLSISLTSPSGTTVQLLSFLNGFGSTTGMSLYFSDAGQSLSEPQGIILPAEPLSTFNGEPTHGLWTLTITDNLGMDDGYVFGGCLNIDSSPCISSLAGKAFYDFDSNGVQDANEPPYANGLIENTVDESMFFTNLSGLYLKCFPEGEVSLSLVNAPDYYISQPASHDVTLVSGTTLSNLDFALTPNGPFQDLKVDLYTVMPDRPGFPNTYFVSCQNPGTVCVENVVVELELDEWLTITGVDADNMSFSNNLATVTFAELCPQETVLFEVHQVLSDTVSIGALLTSTALITPVTGDETPENNLDVFESEVVGAFDPNDKWVSHTEITPQFLSEGKSLEYKVRFQNTGNYYAERVVIVDTLDSDLDLSTFELLTYSHPVVVTNEGHVVYFTFDEIFLPDSTTDEPGSHGYVRYNIEPFPGFSETSSIDNTAHIFFDFNEAIITNTVNTVLAVAVGLHAYTITPGVFPNPSADQLSLTWTGEVDAEQIGLYDLAGKLVKTFKINHSEMPLVLNIGSLAGGTYILRMEGVEYVRPVKVVKM